MDQPVLIVTNGIRFRALHFTLAWMGLEPCRSEYPADQLSVRKKPGIGLVSMRERLRPIGGRLVVQSAPSRGTRIHVSVPAIRASRVLR